MGEDPKRASHRGQARGRPHLEWYRREYGADWTNDTFAKAAIAHLELVKGGTFRT